MVNRNYGENEDKGSKQTYWIPSSWCDTRDKAERLISGGNKETKKDSTKDLSKELKKVVTKDNTKTKSPENNANAAYGEAKPSAVGNKPKASGTIQD